MTRLIDTVLLLALPASGKSEIRRYLAHIPPEMCRNDFSIGETVQLDDFPYVHMMRRMDEELVMRGGARMFFHAPDKPFISSWDWGTLIHLVNEDYCDLLSQKRYSVSSAAVYLCDRLDSASLKAGGHARFSKLSPSVRQAVAGALETEAERMLEEKNSGYPDTLKDRTLIIEFARGGPQGSGMPLPQPLGYRYSISRLDDRILEKAAILYIWVTPEESRRKNEARTDPDNPGSILHHGVPMDVMLNDYGCDDMDWLEADSSVKGTIEIVSASTGRKFNIPAVRFDNRKDKTSFLRQPANKWMKTDINTVHEGLKKAMAQLNASREKISSQKTAA